MGQRIRTWSCFVCDAFVPSDVDFCSRKCVDAYNKKTGGPNLKWWVTPTEEERREKQRMKG